jgi:hypothetical protein
LTSEQEDAHALLFTAFDKVVSPQSFIVQFTFIVSTTQPFILQWDSSFDAPVIKPSAATPALSQPMPTLVSSTITAGSLPPVASVTPDAPQTEAKVGKKSKCNIL